MAAVVSENYQLKWHSFGAHLHSSVATSLNSDAFTDVCLLTLDGHQINAHRFVLATCSQYLQQIFRMQTKIATTLPLMIVMPPEISYKTLKTLIQYMYCGETTVSNDILENVLRGGDILQVRGLWRPRNETPANNSNKTTEKNTLAKTPVKVIQKPMNILKPVDSNVKTNESTEKIIPQKVAEVTKECSSTASSIKSEVSSDEIENKLEKNLEKTPTKSPVKDSEDNIQEKNKDDLNYFVIKEEPVDWEEYQEVEMNETEMFHTEMTIKPEIIFPSEDSDYRPDSEENLYSPLTCELCSETYTLPAEWVRHIRTHTDMQPAKRRRGGRPIVEDDDNFPPLQCDLCQKQFPTPGEWVRHIQNTHTETELAESNNGNCQKARVVKPVGMTHKTCTICSKKFPSHASMLIHRRTHTGERPFVCDYCQKGFNVKSNLLRHLRTLHDKIINSADVNPESKSD